MHIFSIVKIAIAYWQNRISPVFDVSNNLYLIYFEKGKEIKRENILLTGRVLFDRVKEVTTLGIDVLICGAISRTLEETLINTGIHVIGFICGDVETVKSAFFRGQLANSSFFMPGCYNKQQRHRFHGGRRRHKVLTGHKI